MSRFGPHSLLAPAGILTRAEAEEIAQRALRNSPAPETRVSGAGELRSARCAISPASARVRMPAGAKSE